MTTPTPTPTPMPTADPIALLKGFAGLRKLTGMYPENHPMIAQKLTELDGMVQPHLEGADAIQIDIIDGDAHMNGVPSLTGGDASAQIIRELDELGISSLHIARGVDRQELLAVAAFLWQLKDLRSVPAGEELARRNVHHVSLGRLVPLDTRWQARQWPEGPGGPLDPAYEESLLKTQQTFEAVTSGRALDIVTVRDVVQLLIYKVARSSAALGQILSVKQYENLTYCHSVNVAILSLLLGRQIGLDEPTIGALVEAALLHDIGKTRIPLQILKKPGALDRRERKTMEAHTTFGAEILVEVEGLQPLTPTVALEHHRGLKRGGYPDLGDNGVPHFMSQIVSVSDVYEAVTGARSYQDPGLPEQACLVLARLAGEQLNTALVKAFVNAVTFFPLGSLVRTSEGETGVVVRTNSRDPLHPTIALLSADLEHALEEIDTSARDSGGAYLRHIAETLRPRQGQPDPSRFLSRAA